MNIELARGNTFTHIKTHLGKIIVAEIRKLEKTMVKQGRRKLCYGRGGGEGLSQNFGHHG